MENTTKTNEQREFWFKRVGTSNIFYIYRNGDPNPIGEFDESEVEVSNYHNDNKVYYNDIKADFEKFQCSSEYAVGHHVESDKLNSNSADSINYMKVQLNTLINGCCNIMYSDHAIASKYAGRAIEWLSSTDFYDAPASTKYHDSEPHGLLRHTLKVVNAVLDLSALPQFKNVDIAEVTLAAIVHDWCKINFYEPYMKNVKNETTGAWEQVPSYRYKGSQYPLGHGVTSMFIASRLFKLTIDQAMAIRWHMGEYNVCDFERSDLMDANEKSPMVQMLQIADRMAII